MLVSHLASNSSKEDVTHLGEHTPQIRLKRIKGLEELGAAGISFASRQ
jgi:hypothetical protein